MPVCCQENKDSYEVPFDKVKLFLDNYRNITKKFVLIGGDVILSSNLEKILDYGIKNHINISIMTKSKYINKKYLKKAYTVDFSIDSVNGLNKLEDYKNYYITEGYNGLYVDLVNDKVSSNLWKIS